MILQDDGTVQLDGPFRVVSTNRPLPPGALPDLQEFTVIEELEAVDVDQDLRPIGVSDGTTVGAVTDDRPDEDTLEQYELTVVEEPIEVWVDDGTEMRIFPQRAVNERDGEVNLSPAEVAEFVRDDERWRPVEVPQDSVFGPIEEVSLSPDQMAEVANSFAQEHSQIGRWSAVSPSDYDLDRAGIFADEVIAEWKSPTKDGDTVYVTLGLNRNDGEDETRDPQVNAETTGTGDISITGAPGVYQEENIDTALETTKEWLENTPAVTNYPSFTATVRNALLSPIVDLMQTIGGVAARMKADSDGLTFALRSVGNQIEAEIDAEAMVDYDLQAAGTAVVNIADVKDVTDDPNFSADIAIDADGSSKEATFDGEAIEMRHIGSSQSPTLEIGSNGAQSIVDGQRFNTAVDAAKEINGDTPVLFAIQDSTTFMEFQASDTADAVKMDLEGVSPIGEGAGTARYSRVLNIKKAWRRPSINDITLNISEDGRVGLNFAQDNRSFEGTNVNIILQKRGDISDFDLTPPATPEIPDDISPPAPKPGRDADGEPAGTDDAVNGLIEAPQQARNWLIDANERGLEDNELIELLDAWVSTLDPIRDELLTRLVAGPTDELVDYADTFVSNIETLTDAAEELVSMRGGMDPDDPEIPDTDEIPDPDAMPQQSEMDRERETQLDDPDVVDATPTPDGVEDVETTPETDRILDMFAEEVVEQMEVEEVEEFAELPDGYNENQWDVAVVANPDGDFGNRLIVRPLDPDVRRSPDLEITDDVIDKLTKKDLAPWQYEEGDVIALASLRDEVRRGVGISAFTVEPGNDLLLERTTDASGELDVPAGEWVGVHPEQLLDNASVGDLQAGWETAPINDTNPSTFNVGFDGGRHYHYRELRSPPYFVYKWNTDEQQPEELMDDPPTVNHAALNVTPAGEEVIGLDKETENRQKPPAPVYASEFEDEYDLEPFLQSADDVKQLVEQNRDILIRVGGFIRETEVSGGVPDGAGFRVPDRVFPDGVYYIPASSNESDFELVGIKRVSDLPAVISTNRPLTMQARDTLEEYGIEEEITAKEIDNPPLGVGEDTVVGLRLREAPPVETTERLEVKFKDPVEVWESDRDGKIFIYRDRVVSEEQGQMPTEPETAARESRAQDRFSPVDVPDDSPFAGLEPEGEPPEEDDTDDKTFEVKVGAEQGVAQRVRADLTPRIKTGEDPNDIADAIYDRMNDDLTEKELVRFIGRSGNTDSEVAIATVRGGELEEARFGSEVLVRPEELVEFEWVVDFPSVDQEPTAGEINEAYPGLNMPQAQTLTDYVRSVDDLLNFTPAGLQAISGIGSATVDKLTDQPARTIESETLRELRDGGDDTDDEPDGTTDDSGVSMTDILNDRRIGEWATIEGDVGGDEVVLLALDGTRTVGIHLNKVELPDQDILESFGVLFDEPVETGLTAGGIPDTDAESVAENTRLGDVTFRAELIEDHLESNPPADVREMLEPDDEPEPDDTTDAGGRFREAVSEARDVLDDAEELVAEGELRREGRINNLSSALTQIASFDVDEDTLQTDAAMNAIEELERLTEQARELVENPERKGERGTQRDMVPDDRLEEQLEDEPDDGTDEEPDDGADDGADGGAGEDGELDRDEIKRIVEAATEGVTANPVILNDDLQRIRLEVESDAAVSFDFDGPIIATGGDSRAEMAIEAIRKWEDAVDLSTADVEAVNNRRMQIGQSETVDIEVPPVGEQEIEADTDEEPGEEPEPEPEPEVQADTAGDVQQELREELAALGLPTGVDAPVDITFEKTGDKSEPNLLKARHNPPSLWADILESDIPPLQGQDDNVTEFVGGVIERIINATDFSKVDVGAINARRERLNEKYGAEIPLLREAPDGEGTPTQPGDEPDEDGEDAEPDVETHLIKAVDTGYAPLGDVTDAKRREVDEQTEAALGDADQFDSGTTVGEAFIDPDGEVAVRVSEGERILDAKRKQEDIEQRTPEFDMNAPLTAKMVRDAFPRLLGNGQPIADAFDTLNELVNAPLSEIDDTFGVGRGTIERMVDVPTLDMSRSIIDQRNRPLGIEEETPDPSPTPDVVTGDEVGQLPQAGTADDETPDIAVSIPPTAPAGEKWLARQIERGNRVQPNDYKNNPIVEIVFPERLSGQVRNVVANNDISRGGQSVTVQRVSFADEIPQEAASLKSIQFLLRAPAQQPATNLKSSGFDIDKILASLSDNLVIVAKSPLVAAPITFETNPDV
jgi:hypothetical protein